MKSEWAGLGLSKPILQTLKELKFSKMTPVQVKIPTFSQFLHFQTIEWIMIKIIYKVAL